MSLRVEQTLGLAQLQDHGRFGVRHLGVTQGGALDWISAGLANHLLGNSADCPVLEIPLGGLTLRCEQDTTLALTGADLQATLDDQLLAPWCSFAVKAGQRLVFNTPLYGVRAYLAAPDGFRAPQVLGSCATVVRDRLGGLQGNGAALQAGDQLDAAARRPKPVSLPEPLRLDLRRPVQLELVPGAQIARFSGVSLFQAFNQVWRVDARADRMGVRLQGPVLHYQGEALVSEGIALGAVQVPPDGQPIILLNDRQTIGGYPRLGALSPVAVARLAQCGVGEPVRLRISSHSQARERYLHWLELIDGRNDHYPPVHRG